MPGTQRRTRGGRRRRRWQQPSDGWRQRQRRRRWWGPAVTEGARGTCWGRGWRRGRSANGARPGATWMGQCGQRMGAEWTGEQQPLGRRRWMPARGRVRGTVGRRGGAAARRRGRARWFGPLRWTRRRSLRRRWSSRGRDKWTRTGWLGSGLCQGCKGWRTAGGRPG